VGATGRHTAADIAVLMAQQDGVCASPWCMEDVRKRRRVDHLLPLACGGSNDPANLQILCPHCNLSKGTLDMEAFVMRHGIRAGDL
jgi:5-methylcytosine-specific restriction endonuclease McrA